MINDKDLFDNLKAAAKSGHNPLSALGYHNWEHVQHSVLTHDRLYGVASESDLNGMAEKLALYFHDIVYIPKNNTNEQLSAAMFVWYARRFVDPETWDSTWCEFMDNRRGSLQASKPHNLLEAVMYVPMWIEHTTVYHHMAPSVEGAIHPRSISRVLDCDLAMLAKPYPAFRQHQLAIIQENSPSEYKSNSQLAREMRESTLFLSRFLEKANIYRTVEARDAFEKQARDNIEAWLREVDDVQDL